MVDLSEITICMPVFERTDYFEIAIGSALACGVKILIVDNASSHNWFEDFAKRHEGIIRYYRNPKNIGFIGNWNKCLELSESTWVSFLHDDDELLPGAINKLVDTMNKFPGKGLYFGLENTIDENGKIRQKAVISGDEYQEVSAVDYAFRNQFLAAGFMMDRKFALELGGYSKFRPLSPDWDLYFKICRWKGAVKVAYPVANYRQYFSASRLTSRLEISGRFFLGFVSQTRKNIILLSSPPSEEQLAVMNAGFSAYAQGIFLRYGFLIPRRTRAIHWKYALIAPVKFSKHLYFLRWLPSCIAILLICFYSYFRRNVLRHL